MHLKLCLIMYIQFEILTSAQLIFHIFGQKCIDNNLYVYNLLYDLVFLNINDVLYSIFYLQSYNLKPHKIAIL